MLRLSFASAASLLSLQSLLSASWSKGTVSHINELILSTVALSSSLSCLCENKVTWIYGKMVYLQELTPANSINTIQIFWEQFCVIKLNLWQYTLPPCCWNRPRVWGHIVDGVAVSVTVVLRPIRVQVDGLHGTHEGVPHAHAVLHHDIQILRKNNIWL